MFYVHVATSSVLIGKNVGVCYQATDWDWYLSSTVLETAAEVCHINATDATAIPPQTACPAQTSIPPATPEPAQTVYPV